MRKNAVLYLLERLKHWFFVTFDIIVSYIFPWKFHWNSSSRSVVGIRLFLLETWRDSDIDPPLPGKTTSKKPSLNRVKCLPFATVVLGEPIITVFQQSCLYNSCFWVPWWTPHQQRLPWHGDWTFSYNILQL